MRNLINIKQLHRYIYIQSVAISLAVYAPKIIKIGGSITNLQSFNKWRVF